MKTLVVTRDMIHHLYIGKTIWYWKYEKPNQIQATIVDIDYVEEQLLIQHENGTVRFLFFEDVLPERMVLACIH